MAKKRKRASKVSMRATALVEAEAVAGRRKTLSAALKDARHQASPRRKKAGRKAMRRASAKTHKGRTYLTKKTPTKFQRWLMNSPEEAKEFFGLKRK